MTPDDDELTFGVEEEFFLVDAAGELVPRGPEVVDGTTERDGELQRELISSQVETATPVCRTSAALLDGLTSLRDDLARGAAARGLRLLASGTPVLPGSGHEITRKPRYHRMAEQFGAIARSSATCGCHVHVGVADRETAVRVSNHTRAWLPVLLAITANSPIDGGTVTGYRSWRHVLWSRWPSAGPPPMFVSLEHYENSVAAMLRSGAMMDRAMLYWDVRLSDKQPTLEFRIGDVAASAEEATLAAVLIRGLVRLALRDVAADRAPVSTPDEVLRANLWRAARDGLGGSCLHPESGELVPIWTVVDELVANLREPLGASGDLDFALDVLSRLRSTGGGADRQLAAYRRRERLTDVVDEQCV
ncbi:carboxylate-amine ligase [Amycolatopsis albispora]|uniref:Putative glutamate--cysteine ligase 2 n=1 Tax=Amycolatopsis albispora TaxID=1804986 RepID=A0A344LC34_9PSEU|nr:glutamate--cysteine ligase [Amycolatopsis albispora]AXB45608.1 carboxylate--amine ligase [Amycolatopsis albispora]